MGTKFWYSNCFLSMLAAEVKVSCLLGLARARGTLLYFNLSRDTRRNFPQHDFSSVKVPTRIFKTFSKCLSSLVLELLAYLCPKVEHDVTNHNAIFGSYPVIKSKHKVQFG